MFIWEHRNVCLGTFGTCVYLGKFLYIGLRNSSKLLYIAQFSICISTNGKISYPFAVNEALFVRICVFFPLFRQTLSSAPCFPPPPPRASYAYVWEPMIPACTLGDQVDKVFTYERNLECLQMTLSGNISILM